MNNTIKTEKGIFTIKQRYGKDYKIEMYDLVEDHDILYVEFSSDFNLRDEEVINLFKEFDSEIIQIMKFCIDENIEFYNHFDVTYSLEGNSINLIPLEPFNNNYKISSEKSLKMQLKSNGLRYLKGLAFEEK